MVRGLIEYVNVPRTVAAVVSARKATLHECDTVYSVEDVYDLLEIIAVDAHNHRQVDKYVRDHARV